MSAKNYLEMRDIQQYLERGIQVKLWLNPFRCAAQIRNVTVRIKLNHVWILFDTFAS